MKNFFRQHPEVLPLFLLVLMFAGLQPRIAKRIRERVTIDSLDRGLRIERLVLR